MKPLWSGLAIAVFLVMALASNFTDFLVESSNVTVAINDCEEKPSFIGTLKVSVLYLERTGGMPIGQADGKLFITHQIVNPDTTCTFSVVLNIVIPFATDEAGQFHYTGPEFQHINSEDLFRIEVVVEPDEVEESYGFSKVVVLKYNQELANIVGYEIDPL